MVDKKDKSINVDLLKRQVEQAWQTGPGSGPFAPTPSFAPPSSGPVHQAHTIRKEVRNRIFGLDEFNGQDDRVDEPVSRKVPDLSEMFTAPVQISAAATDQERETMPEVGLVENSDAEPVKSPANLPVTKREGKGKPLSAEEERTLRALDKIAGRLRREISARDWEPESADMIEAVLSFTRLRLQLREGTAERAGSRLLVFLFEEVDFDVLSAESLYSRLKAEGVRDAIAEGKDFTEFVVDLLRLKKMMEMRDLLVLEIWEAFRSVIRNSG